MISLKKINKSEYEFEIKFFGTIALGIVGVALFCLIDAGLNVRPDLKLLFLSNFDSIKVFFYFLMGVAFVTELIYAKSLKVYNEETKKSLYPILLRITVFIIYWCAWSSFCAWLTLTYKPLTALVLIAILLMMILPGLLCCIFSHQLRKDDLKSEEEEKASALPEISTPSVLYLSKRYYSGYYGLICLPVYLIILAIRHIF
ncbi:hypothetical protein [Foetidibacter luteolus]|uniref:hypothetical protein n=1 Tax=Foetidibacter luteolus TaxID=2608880 RepID=UPI00129B56CC|nr:hypothetical protein [Foetidibacter luteolus]